MGDGVGLATTCSKVLTIDGEGDDRHCHVLWGAADGDHQETVDFCDLQAAVPLLEGAKIVVSGLLKKDGKIVAVDTPGEVVECADPKNVVCKLFWQKDSESSVVEEIVVPRIPRHRLCFYQIILMIRFFSLRSFLL